MDVIIAAKRFSMECLPTCPLVFPLIEGGIQLELETGEQKYLEVSITLSKKQKIQYKLFVWLSANQTYEKTFRSMRAAIRKTKNIIKKHFSGLHFI